MAKHERDAEENGGDAVQEGSKKAVIAPQLIPYHFKRGHSGNPAGGKKGPRGPTAMLRKIFEENPRNAQAFAAAVIAHARNGNAAFARMVFDRLDGLLTQKVEVASGPSSLQAGMAALLETTQTESAVPAPTASSDVVQVVAEVVDDDEAGTDGY